MYKRHVKTRTRQRAFLSFPGSPLCPALQSPEAITEVPLLQRRRALHQETSLFSPPMLPTPEGYDYGI